MRQIQIWNFKSSHIKIRKKEKGGTVEKLFIWSKTFHTAKRRREILNQTTTEHTRIQSLIFLSALAYLIIIIFLIYLWYFSTERDEKYKKKVSARGKSRKSQMFHRHEDDDVVECWWSRRLPHSYVSPFCGCWEIYFSVFVGNRIKIQPKEHRTLQRRLPEWKEKGNSYKFTKKIFWKFIQSSILSKHIFIPLFHSTHEFLSRFSVLFLQSSGTYEFIFSIFLVNFLFCYLNFIFGCIFIFDFSCLFFALLEISKLWCNWIWTNQQINEIEVIDFLLNLEFIWISLVNRIDKFSVFLFQFRLCVGERHK